MSRHARRDDDEPLVPPEPRRSRHSTPDEPSGYPDPRPPYQPPPPPAYRRPPQPDETATGRQPPLAGYPGKPTPPLPSGARSRRPPKQPPTPPGQSRAGRLRLRVNPITCDGHGLCAELLPELLSLDDWGYPSPIIAEVPPQLEGHAQRAAQQCPTLAIVLERRRPRRAPHGTGA